MRIYGYQGQKMKECRLRQGLRSAEVAEQIGVTQSAYSSYETGKRDVPKLRRTSLAMALETTWEYLTLGDREENLRDLDSDVDQEQMTHSLPTGQAVEFAFQCGQMVSSLQTMATRWRANPHLLNGLNPAYQDKLTRIFEAAL